jgi:protein SCO1/2
MRRAQEEAEMRRPTDRHRWVRLWALSLVLLPGLVAQAQQPPARPAWQRTTARYRVPDVGLVRADGARVHLRHEIDDGKPVILNFVFTSCAAICPVMSATFAQLQRWLAADPGQVHLVSISIDPEEDTPERLRDYAHSLHAGPHWSFYTGTLEASIVAQRAFDAYRGDKMNHVPVTFLRAAPDQPWVRLEGFATAEAIVAEYRRLRAGPLRRR